MYAGRSLRPASRRSWPARRARRPGGGHHVADQPLVAGPVVGARTTACGHARRVRASTASISPSSIRRPRTSPGSRCGRGTPGSPVGVPPDQVAGAVHALARRAERVGHEPLRGQRRAGRGSRGPAARPARYSSPGHPDRHRPQPARPARTHGCSTPAADRHVPLSAVVRLRPNGRSAQPTVGLGRPVEVCNRRSPVAADPAQRRPAAAPRRRRTPAAAGQGATGQARQRHPDGIGVTIRNVRHRRRCRANARPAHRIAVTIRRATHQPRTPAQRPGRSHHRDVESDRRRCSTGSLRARAGYASRQRSDVVHHRLVGDHDTLRLAGGPGRVDHVGRDGRAAAPQAVGVGRVGTRLRSPRLHDRRIVQHQHRQVRRQGRGQSAVVTTHTGVASASMNRSRSAGYSGSTGRYAPPGLDHGQDRDDQVGRRGAGASATTPSGPTPRPISCRGQPVRARVQLPVGEPRSARGQRCYRTRGGGGLGLEQVRQGPAAGAGPPGRCRSTRPGSCAARRDRAPRSRRPADRGRGHGLQHPHQPARESARQSAGSNRSML